MRKDEEEGLGQPDATRLSLQIPATSNQRVRVAWDTPAVSHRQISAFSKTHSVIALFTRDRLTMLGRRGQIGQAGWPPN
jgi:hypothetical protein